MSQEKVTLFPFATALRHSLRGYSLATFRQDLLAAFVVSLIALPLSMALAIAVGLPPQHGIYTAIVAGVVVPLLGGSVWQVSGPTAAFVVVLAPIIDTYGLRGLVWSGLLAGIILLGMGFMRLGRLIHYIPYPVTTGFTAGIAVVLGILSLNDFLGLGLKELEGSFVEKLLEIGKKLPALDPTTCAVGGVTLLLLFTAGRLIRFLPSALTAVVSGTLLSLLLSYFDLDVATIASTFSYTTVEGVVVSGIPSAPPSFHLPGVGAAPESLFALPSFQELRVLLLPGLTIALLAAIESLLSATVADGLAGTRHDPNAELNAIGVGNILSALASGIPATGAIARTAALVQNGARTPLASSLHAVLIMVYVLLLAPLVGYIPMATLAALLIYTACRMAHAKQFIQILQIAPRSDICVLLVCFVLTVFVDMVVGVSAGMICAAFLLIRRLTELTHSELTKKEEVSPSILSASTPARVLPEGTVFYRFKGPLFFGSIEKAFAPAQNIQDLGTHLVLDIREVPFIDMTGLVALKTMVTSLAQNERRVSILCQRQEIMERIKLKLKNHPIQSSIAFCEGIEALSIRQEEDAQLRFA